jgi:uncharacterized RDD family membrane protein YckC
MTQKANHPTHDHEDEITVETLKTPRLRIQPAPIRRRVLAAFLDSSIVGVICALVLLWLHKPSLRPLTTSAESLVAITLLYYFIQESVFASTIGKHILGLRVVGSGGDPVSVRESLIRNLLRIIDWLPVLYLLGAASIAKSSKRQRLGDIGAGTIVTLAPEKDINPPPAPFLFH